MIFDFGGGWTCADCGKLFEWMPLDTAEQFGKVPADAELSPAIDVPPSKQKKAGLYWTGSGIPKRCSRCQPSGWVVPVVPPGRSFFRR
jgi:hypothetical protein